MERSGRNGDDAKQPAGDGTEPARLPLERSPEGRFIVRSSSHPPTEQTSSIDSSGVHSRPKSGPAPRGTTPVEPAEVELDRSRLSTPAERPRKRKELKQGGTYIADVRARIDTPRALPGSRTSDRPSRGTSAARERSLPLPAMAALAAAPAGPAAEEPRATDEVTRRVRRPTLEASEQAGAADAQLSWRPLVAAGVIAALFVLAIWFLG